jgi:plastocyanin
MRRAVAILMLLSAIAMLAAACQPGATALPSFSGPEATVSAVNIAFQPAEVTLPAGSPLRIVLDNRDAGVPHDIRISQGGREIATSPVVTGPGQTEVRFGPLPAGTYQFTCTIHPSMTGTLTITP